MIPESLKFSHWLSEMGDEGILVVVSCIPSRELTVTYPFPVWHPFPSFGICDRFLEGNYLGSFEKTKWWHLQESKSSSMWVFFNWYVGLPDEPVIFFSLGF